MKPSGISFIDELQSYYNGNFTKDDYFHSINFDCTLIVAVSSEHWEDQSYS